MEGKVFMEKNLETVLRQITRELIARKMDKDTILAAINPPDTEKQAMRVLTWIQEHQEATPKEIVYKALELCEE